MRNEIKKDQESEQPWPVMHEISLAWNWKIVPLNTQKTSRVENEFHTWKPGLFRLRDHLKGEFSGRPKYARHHLLLKYYRK